jgi:hypothetical protein
MRDLGEVDFIVGIRVKRDRHMRTVTLDQHAYIDRMLETFKEYYNVTNVSTPLVERLTSGTVLSDQIFPYRSVIGSLMYLMVETRCDLAYAVGELSRFSDDPKDEHVLAAKRTLSYVNNTRDIVLMYDGKTDLQPIAYADADYANDYETRRSTTGYAITMCNGVISWKSKIQPKTALSTTEAEYIAAAQCCQDICWLQQCLVELGFELRDETEILTDEDHKKIVETHPLQLPFLIREDNQAAISISKNPEKHARTKHIEVKYHFVRELVEEKKVLLKYVSTKDQHADMLTKPIAPELFKKHRFELGLKMLDSRKRQRGNQAPESNE